MSSLEFKNITKLFPGVRALDDMSFVAHSGEVLALLGENGAGKSTLLKVLNGDYKADGGQYLLDGVEQKFKTPLDAIEAGISIIYQERQIVPYLTVAENIFMEAIPMGGFGMIDTREMNRKAQEIIDTFELPIRASQQVRDLSVAHQQMVEIMKAYRRNPKVIAFDEPTASLSDAEIDVLFRIIRKLKAEGLIILYVSHRMKEIFTITDQIVVFKDAFLAGVPAFNADTIYDANYDGTTEDGYDVAAATITAHPEVTKWIVTAPNDEGAAGAARALEAAGLDGEACVVGAGAYIAKEEFKKEYSCFKAAAYFSATVTGNVEGQAAMDFLNNGTEIFGDYHGTIPGDEAYGIYPLGGIMVDPTNYVDVMGPDAE